MASQPLVSIIIPTYNRASLIRETLDSVLAQTYANWECIIVDDGSNDNTDEVIGEYVKKDSRFQYHKRPETHKPGGNGARNYGFEVSKGEYINWFDSDDLMTVFFLENHFNNLISNKEINLSVCLAHIFTETSENLSGEFVPNSLTSEDVIKNLIIGEIFFCTPCSVWKRNFLTGKKLFNEDLFRSQEADFNFRRSTEGIIFKFIEKYLVLVRRGHNSIDSQSNFDYKKNQSQFDYFNNIYLFLKQEKAVFSNEDNNLLQKYCILRMLVFFLAIRNLTNLFKKNNISNFLNLYEKVIKTKISLFLKTKILIGITTILLFNSGYKLIHIKEFDLRKK